MSASREEAERRWPRGWNVEDGTYRDGAVSGFVLGAEWAHPERLRARLEEYEAAFAALEETACTRCYGIPEAAQRVMGEASARHEARQTIHDDDLPGMWTASDFT